MTCQINIVAGVIFTLTMIIFAFSTQYYAVLYTMTVMGIFNPMFLIFGIFLILIPAINISSVISLCDNTAVAWIIMIVNLLLFIIPYFYLHTSSSKSTESTKTN